MFRKKKKEMPIHEITRQLLAMWDEERENIVEGFNEWQGVSATDRLAAHRAVTKVMNQVFAIVDKQEG